MDIDDTAVYTWAQRALDKYNGGYNASDISLNATTYLYGFRDDGNADPALAAASHYLHCRYVACRAYLLGAIIGFAMVLTYDGAVKFVDTLIKKYSDEELVHKFGKAPTSTFSADMILWDLQGLSDGVGDFLFCWGKTTLQASRHPSEAHLRP